MPQGTSRIVTCLRCAKVEKNEGRGLCHACWVWLKRRGRLDEFPRTNRPTATVFAELDRSDPHACWPWPGRINDQNYGMTADSRGAHRWVWKRLVGPLRAEDYLDHLCHNSSTACAGGRTCRHRRCVNPSHLAVVTNAENLTSSPTCTGSLNAAKTHCPQGHPYDAENTRILPRGSRECIRCRRTHSRNNQRKRRARLRLLAQDPPGGIDLKEDGPKKSVAVPEPSPVAGVHV